MILTIADNATQPQGIQYWWLVVQIIGGIFVVIGMAFTAVKVVWPLLKRFVIKSENNDGPVPKETVRVTFRMGDLTWHYGAKIKNTRYTILGGKANVVNITTDRWICVVAVKLAKSNILVDVIVKAPGTNMYSSKAMLQPEEIGELDFHIAIGKVVREYGKEFVCDIAFIDQYANEHWIKKVSFASAGKTLNEIEGQEKSKK